MLAELGEGFGAERRGGLRTVEPGHAPDHFRLTEVVARPPHEIRHRAPQEIAKPGHALGQVGHHLYGVLLGRCGPDLARSQSCQNGAEPYFVGRDRIIEGGRAVGRRRRIKVVLRTDAGDVGLEDCPLATRHPDIGLPFTAFGGPEALEQHAGNEMLVAP